MPLRDDFTDETAMGGDVHAQHHNDLAIAANTNTNTTTLLVDMATDAVAIRAQRGTDSSPTADIQTWERADNTVLAEVNASGQFLEGGRRLAALTSRLTSTATVASATQTATGLSVTLDANKVYSYQIIGAWQTTATASTWAPRMSFSGTYTSGLTSIQSSTNASAVVAGSTVTANTTAFTTTTAGAATLNLPFQIRGMLVTGASSGNLIMEQARPAGTGTITIAIGTMLLVTEVA